MSVTVMATISLRSAARRSGRVSLFSGPRRGWARRLPPVQRPVPVPFPYHEGAADIHSLMALPAAEPWLVLARTFVGRQLYRLFPEFVIRRPRGETTIEPKAGQVWGRDTRRGACGDPGGDRDAHRPARTEFRYGACSGSSASMRGRSPPRRSPGSVRTWACRRSNE